MALLWQKCCSQRSLQRKDLWRKSHYNNAECPKIKRREKKGKFLNIFFKKKYFIKKQVLFCIKQKSLNTRRIMLVKIHLELHH